MSRRPPLSAACAGHGSDSGALRRWPRREYIGRLRSGELCRLMLVDDREERDDAHKRRVQRGSGSIDREFVADRAVVDIGGRVAVLGMRVSCLVVRRVVRMVVRMVVDQRAGGPARTSSARSGVTGVMRMRGREVHVFRHAAREGDREEGEHGDEVTQSAPL